MMRHLVKRLLSPLPHAVRWYLSKQRIHHTHGLSLVVMPGVFHPGLFFSTRLLMDFLSVQSLREKQCLEVGGGSGAVSILMAKMGGTVVVSDISKRAIGNIELNMRGNQVSMDVIHSDLFDSISRQSFDWIVVNPPYYPHKPEREEEFAWYCGEQHEYFLRFFSSLASYIKNETMVVMVLSDVCDLNAIKRIARDHCFEMMLLKEKNVFIDGKNYIFKFIPVARS